MSKTASMKLPNFKAMDCYERADAFLRSEQRYVSEFLRTLYEVQTRLRCHNQLNFPLLTDKEISEIFGDIVSIYQFAQGLLTELSELRWSGPDQFIHGLSAALDKNIPFFKMYGSYILNVRKAIRSLKEITEDKKRAQIKSFVMVSEMAAEKSLNTLLEAPVKRWPQYLQYITAIANSLPPSHEAYESLQGTVSSFQKVTDQISTNAENFMRRQRVVEIQQDEYKDKFLLVDPTRKCYRSGTIRLTIGSKTKDYRAHLFSDFILITTSGFLSGSQLKCIIPLSGAKITSTGPQSISLYSPLTTESYGIEFTIDKESSVERSTYKWLCDLQEAYQDYHKLKTKILTHEDFEKMIQQKPYEGVMIERHQAESLEQVQNMINAIRANRKQELAEQQQSQQQSQQGTSSTVVSPAPSAHSTPVKVAPPVPSKPSAMRSPPPAVPSRPAAPPRPTKSSGTGGVGSATETPESSPTKPRDMTVAPTAATPEHTDYSDIPPPPMVAIPSPSSAAASTAPLTTPGGTAIPPPPVLASLSGEDPAASAGPSGSVPPPPAMSAPATAAADGQAPPPPPMMAPPSGDSGSDGGRPSLLAAIRGGAQLKSVDPDSIPPASASGDSDGGFLAAIRGGAQLKKVETNAHTPAVSDDPQAGFLAAIRGGAQLKKVEPIERKTPSASDDPHDSFLAAIRGGAQLKKVEPIERKVDTTPVGMTEDIQRSLAKYRKFVQEDSESEDDDW